MDTFVYVSIYESRLDLALLTSSSIGLSSTLHRFNQALGGVGETPRDSRRDSGATDCGADPTDANADQGGRTSEVTSQPEIPNKVSPCRRASVVK
jgi:hypothetical protein